MPNIQLVYKNNHSLLLRIRHQIGVHKKNKDVLCLPLPAILFNTGKYIYF